MPGSFQLVTTGFPTSPDMFEVSWWGALGKYFWIELSDDLGVGAWNFLPNSFGDARAFSGTDSEIRYSIYRTNPLFGTDKLFVRVKVFDLNTYNPFTVCCRSGIFYDSGSAPNCLYRSGGLPEHHPSARILGRFSCRADWRRRVQRQRPQCRHCLDR